MESLFSPLHADSATITDETVKQKTGCAENSELSSIHKPSSRFCTVNSSNSRLMSPPSHHPVCHLYPFCCCLQNPAGNQRSWLLQPNHNGLQLQLSIDQQEQKAADAYRTKVARNKRKIARQKSLCKNTPPPPLPCPNPSRTESKEKLSFDGAGNSQGNNKNDLYMFVTPDNKKLRVLLKKELKNSDVGSLGRIVLPKKEAEENLPFLYEKDGILVVIRDVYSNKKWSLKFKYWSNNKSRMYVLENTGDFVKQNGMETGDSLTLYEDESKNLYYTVKKVERAITEEEASLELLIEELKHKEEQQDHSLVTISMGTASSPNNMGIDECYNGLGVLPDVHWYNFSL